MLTDMPRAGSNTMPAEYCFDFSGFRFALPPKVTPNCVTQSNVSLVVGQRSGSERPVAEVPAIFGVHNWYRVGARKPVPYELRRSIVRVGCQRKPTFGFVVVPKSL